MFAHSDAHHTRFGWWSYLSCIPNPLIPLAVVFFIGAELGALIVRPMRRYQIAELLSSLGVIVTEAVKDQLNFFFGRAWPESWMGGNPSFIRNGVYGFHLLQGGGAYNSFPSGHTASTWAVLAVLWFCYPAFRIMLVAAGIAVGGGLVILNYHFLGDVIAGAFLGASTGWMGIVLWDVMSPSSVTGAARGGRVKE